jgi:hypothetical protein
MPKFGSRSRKELKSAHPDLQRLFNEVIKEFDCAVLCGHRGRADQDKAFQGGFSKVRWPNSKHNKTPSLACDVMPHPLDWKDRERLNAFAVVVKDVAKRLGIKIRWGGDFKTFFDGPHWELI